MSAENIRDYYRNQGVQVERERIIKLLQEELCSCVLAECLIAQAVALIKGEK